MTRRSANASDAGKDGGAASAGPGGGEARGVCGSGGGGGGGGADGGGLRAEQLQRADMAVVGAPAAAIMLPRVAYKAVHVAEFEQQCQALVQDLRSALDACEAVEGARLAERDISVHDLIIPSMGELVAATCARSHHPLHGRACGRFLQQPFSTPLSSSLSPSLPSPPRSVHDLIIPSMEELVAATVPYLWSPKQPGKSTQPAAKSTQPGKSTQYRHAKQSTGKAAEPGAHNKGPESGTDRVRTQRVVLEHEGEEGMEGGMEGRMVEEGMGVEEGGMGEGVEERMCQREGVTGAEEERDERAEEGGEREDLREEGGEGRMVGEEEEDGGRDVEGERGDGGRGREEGGEAVREAGREQQERGKEGEVGTEEEESEIEKDSEKENGGSEKENEESEKEREKEESEKEGERENERRALELYEMAARAFGIPFPSLSHTASHAVSTSRSQQLQHHLMSNRMQGPEGADRGSLGDARVMRDGGNSEQRVMHDGNSELRATDDGDTDTESLALALAAHDGAASDACEHMEYHNEHMVMVTQGGVDAPGPEGAADVHASPFMSPLPPPLPSSPLSLPCLSPDTRLSEGTCEGGGGGVLGWDEEGWEEGGGDGDGVGMGETRLIEWNQEEAAAGADNDSPPPSLALVPAPAQPSLPIHPPSHSHLHPATLPPAPSLSPPPPRRHGPSLPPRPSLPPLPPPVGDGGEVEAGVGAGRKDPRLLRSRLTVDWLVRIAETRRHCMASAPLHSLRNLQEGGADEGEGGGSDGPASGGSWGDEDEEEENEEDWEGNQEERRDGGRRRGGRGRGKGRGVEGRGIRGSRGGRGGGGGGRGRGRGGGRGGAKRPLEALARANLPNLIFAKIPVRAPSVLICSPFASAAHLESLARANLPNLIFAKTPGALAFTPAPSRALQLQQEVVLRVEVLQGVAYPYTLVPHLLPSTQPPLHIPSTSLQGAFLFKPGPSRALRPQQDVVLRVEVLQQEKRQLKVSTVMLYKEDGRLEVRCGDVGEVQQQEDWQQLQ
ncbi:unnamed protein product [Closterium sp. Naga37s-1]|nr:unnamed protein product [Closterium sp. Naga37s-1]